LNYIFHKKTFALSDGEQTKANYQINILTLLICERVKTPDDVIVMGMESDVFWLPASALLSGRINLLSVLPVRLRPKALRARDYAETVAFRFRHIIPRRLRTRDKWSLAPQLLRGLLQYAYAFGAT